MQFKNIADNKILKRCSRQKCSQTKITLTQNILVKNVIYNGYLTNKLIITFFPCLERLKASLGDFCPGYFAGHGFQPKTITTNHFPHAA